MRDPVGIEVSLDRFGQLVPEAVLLDAHGPRIFTFREPSDNRLMLAVQIAEGVNVPGREIDVVRFALVPTSQAIVTGLQERSVPILTAIRQPHVWILDVGPTGESVHLWSLGGDLDANSLGLACQQGLELPGPTVTLPISLPTAVPGRTQPTFCAPASPQDTEFQFPNELRGMLGMTNSTSRLPGGLSRYRFQSQLGSGGFAYVFRAWDQQDFRLVAIKILRTLFPDPSQRESVEGWLEREGRVMRRLTEKGSRRTPPVYQIVRRQERPFMLVMGLLTGCTLAVAADRRRQASIPWPLEQICLIVHQCAEGLGQAHDEEVIHRDVKPNNIWLRYPLPLPADTVPPVIDVVIMDFGIARVLGESTLTPEGAVGPGTVRYRSPEQAQGGQELTVLSDVYSLGVVLGELLFGADFPDHRTIPLPGTVDVPQWLLNLLRRMVAESPTDRPSTNEIARTIEAHMTVDPSTHHCIVQRLPSDRLVELQGLAVSAVVRAGLTEVGDELAGRLEALTEFGAAAGQLLAQQLGWLLVNQFNTTLERIQAECRLTEESLDQPGPRASTISPKWSWTLLNLWRKQTAHTPLLRVSEFRERMKSLVQEFHVALAPWNGPLMRWSSASEKLQEVRAGLDRVWQLLDDLSQNEKQERPQLASAIRMVREHLSRLRHYRDDLGRIHREAVQDLALTLRRSAVIRIA